MPLTVRLVFRALRRPRLWPLLLAGSWRFRRRRWLARAPFLPIPAGGYLAWRMETAYGDPEALPPIDELERYLRWSVRGGGGREVGHR